MKFTKISIVIKSNSSKEMLFCFTYIYTSHSGEGIKKEKKLKQKSETFFGIG